VKTGRATIQQQLQLRNTNSNNNYNNETATTKTATTITATTKLTLIEQTFVNWFHLVLGHVNLPPELASVGNPDCQTFLAANMNLNMK
jgi:hypothetical protein